MVILAALVQMRKNLFINRGSLRTQISREHRSFTLYIPAYATGYDPLQFTLCHILRALLFIICSLCTLYTMNSESGHPKLTRMNYHSWKLDAEIQLTGKGALGIILGMEKRLVPPTVPPEPGMTAASRAAHEKDMRNLCRNIRLSRRNTTESVKKQSNGSGIMSTLIFTV